MEQRQLTDYEKLIDMLVKAEIKYEIRNPFNDRWQVVINPNAKSQAIFTFWDTEEKHLQLAYVN